MDDFREQVKKGFSKCKTDIDSVHDENNILKSKVELLNNEVIELKAQLKGINIALDYIKDFNKNAIASVNSNNEVINTSSTNIPKQNVVLEQPIYEQKIIEKPQKIQDPYEALLAFKAKSNKREILKQKLVSMVGESGIILSELKFLFVEHYKYCSKATYYNYLKELELEKMIKIERENSKNYIYLNNSIDNFNRIN